LERRNLDLMNVVYTKRMARLGMLMKSGKPIEASEIGKVPMSPQAQDRDRDIRRLSANEAKDLLSKKIQEENLKHINDLARKAVPASRSGLSSGSGGAQAGADAEFSLHPSEVDLSLTNFKNIDDFNDDPARVRDFNGTIGADKSGKIYLKETNSTDLMNKVAGMLVQGDGLHSEAPATKGSTFMTEKPNEVPLECGSDTNVWPISASQMRDLTGE